MARLPRLYAPRVPQLLQARFAHPLAAAGEPAPTLRLDLIRGWLAEEVGRQALALHAWVLLPEHLTLLATPGDARAAVLLMQALGRRMGSGLLRTRVYAGRYHNALLEPGRWVLPAMTWVEWLPVWARQADQAVQWPWSSAAVHTGMAANTAERMRAATGLALVGAPSDTAGLPADGPPMKDHPDYWQLGDTPFARQALWRQRLSDGPTAAQRLALEQALHGQWALGEKIFLAHLAKLASRRVRPVPRGRPRKVADEPPEPF